MPSSGTVRLRRFVVRLRRGFLRSDGFVLLVLVAAALVVGWLSIHESTYFPPSMLSLVVLVGGFLLSVRGLWLLLAVVAGVLAYEIRALGWDGVRPGNLLVVAVTAGIVVAVARSRARLGVQAMRGESMLVDLRDRLRLLGEVPELPGGWHAEALLRPAHGASFSGDFLVVTRSRDGRLLELVVCDVSGKGVDAGTRALLLSGALGGLLGAMPAEEFLEAADAYLWRQRWDDGFATAVHLAIDLDTGSYVLGSAGHPPAAHFLSGSGRWSLTSARGPALGVDLDAVFLLEHGTLAPGDALLLYTDGVVEIPGGDIDVGIDKLLGAAERLVPQGFRRGARKLVDVLGRRGLEDDRALVLLWRE
jgi:hypothetical protein